MSQLRRPLVAALLAYLAGLLAALRFAPAPEPLFAAAALLAPLCLIGRAERGAPLPRALLLLLFAAVGSAVGAVGAAAARSDCRVGLRDGQPLVAQGFLGTAHREGAAGAGAPLLPLEAAVLVGAGCAGEIRLRAPPGEPPIPAGTYLRVFGEWRTFGAPEGRPAWPPNARFIGFLRADSVAPLETDLEPSAWLSARAWADDRFARLFPQHQPLVEALLLGRREYVEPAVSDRFARAGLTHLLAISGMHVGLIAAVLLLLGSIVRLSRPATIFATLLLVWLYIGVIGAPPSAVRSAVMVSVALCAALLQRPTASLAGVAAAALAILSYQPLALLDPGFQLSFLGILALIVLRRPLLRLLPEQYRRQGWRRQLADPIVVGVAAFLATAPVVAHHFGVVSPISILAGLPAVPLTSLALIGAFASVTIDPVLPAVASLFAGGTTLALDLVDRIAAFAAAVPYGHSAVAPPPWWMWGAAAAAALAVARSGIFHGPLRRLAGIGSAIAVFIAWPLGARATGAGIEVHFIDVGQGDAIALRTPRDRWILVDAGPASDDYDAGERRVVPFLRRRGVRTLEALVLTHPDLDHIGGAAAVLRSMRVRHVFEPGLAVGRGPYLQLLRTLESEAVEWRAARTGRSIDLDGVRFDFLWPDPDVIDESLDANHISAVLHVTYGDFELLLTGDAGVEVEEVLVRRNGADLESDILKLGHHGSATSSAPFFLDAVGPELAVVSAGRRNRYGHPAPAVVDAVEARSIQIARTDREGTISILVEPGGARWHREDW